MYGNFLCFRDKESNLEQIELLKFQLGLNKNVTLFFLMVFTDSRMKRKLTYIYT